MRGILPRFSAPGRRSDREQEPDFQSPHQTLCLSSITTLNQASSAKAPFPQSSRRTRRLHFPIDEVTILLVSDQPLATFRRSGVPGERPYWLVVRSKDEAAIDLEGEYITPLQNHSTLTTPLDGDADRSTTTRRPCPRKGSIWAQWTSVSSFTRRRDAIPEQVINPAATGARHAHYDLPTETPCWGLYAPMPHRLAAPAWRRVSLYIYHTVKPYVAAATNFKFGLD